MGKGLNLKKDGEHVAFAAGTGALVYLDVVARLIMQSANMSLEGIETFDPSFKFHFYVSFATRKDAIGLELCEALVKLNGEQGKDNFQLHVRISNEGGARWHADWIKKTVLVLGGANLKKEYVCGPPMMK